DRVVAHVALLPAVPASQPPTLCPSRAGVAELADAPGLVPGGPQGPWRFDPSRPHFVATVRSAVQSAAPADAAESSGPDGPQGPWRVDPSRPHLVATLRSAVHSAAPADAAESSGPGGPQGPSRFDPSRAHFVARLRSGVRHRHETADCSRSHLGSDAAGHRRVSERVVVPVVLV